MHSQSQRGCLTTPRPGVIPFTMTTGQTNRPAAAGQRLELPLAGLRLRLGSVRRRARNAAMAAAIAANPDMPVPTAAMSVHPDPPPELGATAMMVATMGAVGLGLFAGAIAGGSPVEGDGEPAIVAERGLVRTVVVTVTVTVAWAPGVPGVPAVDVAVPVATDGPNTTPGDNTTGGDNTAGGDFGDAPGEVAR